MLSVPISRALIPSVLAILLSACGGGGGGSTDTTAPRVTGSNFGDDVIAVDTTLEIYLSETLRSSSVTGASFVLEDEDGFEQFGAFRYNNTTLTFTPYQVLRYDTAYTLTLSGMRDPYGNPMEQQVLRFRTHRNSLASEFRYALNGSQVVGYGVTYYNGQGDKSYVIQVDDAGADDLWNSNDDMPSSYLAYSYSNDRLSGETRYTSAGDNGLWLDGDDGIESYGDYQYTIDDRLEAIVSYNGAGADGLWRTADDDITQRIVFEYDGNGLKQRQITYSGAGGDGIWATDDDTVQGYFGYAYTNGLMAAKVPYVTAGNDGVWFTADDTTSGFERYRYNALGLMIEKTLFQGIGPDNTWETADDTVTEYRYAYYQENRLGKVTLHNAVGPDGDWRTADDVRTAYNAYQRSDQGTLEGIVSYNAAGDDGLWETADDIIGGRYVYQRDASGKQTREIQYQGDATDEASIIAYTDTGYAVNGTRETRKVFISPGADATWFTGDDFQQYGASYDTTQ